mgnify:CR=1 FL=1
MKYLIAFDKFKGALSAAEAGRIAASEIADLDPSGTILQAPLTDGGEGFATILAGALDGRLLKVEVAGPRFKPAKGRITLVEASHIPPAAMERLQLPPAAATGTIAFVEMASASGYEQLADGERDPWKTTTLGTGQLMKAAVEAGAGAIVLGIGGSATNDCGAGALEALGVVYYDRDLQPVKDITPAEFKRVTSAGSMSHLLDSFPPVRIACDVSNPLLGENGATRVYGPQKGLKEEDFERLERNVRKMATRLLGLFGRDIGEWDKLMEEPGSGAAGGIGFALRHALPDSRFVEGFPLVAELLDLEVKAGQADLILTGEGRIDESSLHGKGPVALVRRARPDQSLVLLAGSVQESTAAKLRSSHSRLRVQAISDPSWPLEKALAETQNSLRRALRKILSGAE